MAIASVPVSFPMVLGIDVGEDRLSVFWLFAGRGRTLPGPVQRITVSRTIQSKRCSETYISD